jgi:hypothetical protein
MKRIAGFENSSAQARCVLDHHIGTRNLTWRSDSQAFFRYRAELQTDSPVNASALTQTTRETATLQASLHDLGSDIP